MSLWMCLLDGLFTHVILLDVFCIVMAVVLSGVFCSSRKMPQASTSLAGVGDDAVVCAWGQRSVSNRVWQQGQRANAPCWAHTEALAGQFTSLRLLNAPPCSPLRRLRGRLSHAQLWRTQLLHRQLFHTQLYRTQLVHTQTITQLPHTHAALAHTTVSPSYITPFEHTHTTLPHTNVFNLSILHHLLYFVFPSFPVPLQLLFLVTSYWKKLTCGVIRSFNWVSQSLWLRQPPLMPSEFGILPPSPPLAPMEVRWALRHWPARSVANVRRKSWSGLNLAALFSARWLPPRWRALDRPPQLQEMPLADLLDFAEPPGPSHATAATQWLIRLTQSSPPNINGALCRPQKIT